MAKLTVDAARLALSEAEAIAKAAAAALEAVRENRAEGTAEQRDVSRAARVLQRALDHQEDARAAVRIAERREAEEAAAVKKAAEHARRMLAMEARRRYGQLCRDLDEAIDSATVVLGRIERQMTEIEPLVGRGGANWPTHGPGWFALLRGASAVRKNAGDEARRFAARQAEGGTTR